ncbi:MAG: hypothetical protein C4534_08625 [Gaiellales bacterium]|nr:MAG: hypothetical protein C4534_08625 [Gaiellales bacterium]
MFILAAIALTLIIVSSRDDPTPLLDEETIAASQELASTETPLQVPLAAAGELELMLPVVGQSVTAIGYHPVEDDDVISLKPEGKQVNASVISGIGQILDDDGGIGYYVMDEDSKVSPTTSMDVGAPYGTFVYTPVDGTIVGIKTYEFAGKCPDTEVRIQPLNQSNMVVVMTHLGNIEATLGQPVKAGVTRIGSINKLDDCLTHKISEFTSDSGNHVHIQVELYRRDVVS